MTDDRSATERSGGAAERSPDLPPDPPLARAAARRRRLRDAGIALQLGGVALLASPFVDVFAGGGRILGLPAGATLLFVLWFGLIALAALLGRRQARAEGEG